MKPADVPPHNIEAEQSVLGAILLTELVLPAVIEEGVTAGCFYRDRHATIWQAMVDMREAGKGVDVVTVTARLAGKVDRLDIDVLAGTVPNVGNVREYARIVVELAEWRTILLAGHEFTAAAYALDYARRDAWASLCALHRERSARLGRPALREVAARAADAS